MNWKTAFRSFYYENATEPDDIKLDPKTTALLVSVLRGRPTMVIEF